jgi:hypothetical protein
MIHLLLVAHYTPPFPHLCIVNSINKLYLFRYSPTLYSLLYH